MWVLCRQLPPRCTPKLRPKYDGRLPSNGSQRRPFSLQSLASHPVDTLSQTLLDFSSSLSALPLPEFLPPTAAGIIATTLLVRTSITLPSFIWSRRRVARHRDLVVPEIVAWRKPFAKDLAEKAKAEPNSRDYFDKEFKKAAIAKRAELLKKYHCRPIWTTLVPIAVHVPVFIFTSYVIRNACLLPNSPLNVESFLSSTVLSQPEAFSVFPFAVGAVSLASFQLSRRLAQRRKSETQWAAQTVQAQQAQQSTPHVLAQASSKRSASNKTKGKNTDVLTEIPLPRSQTPTPQPQKDTVMEKLAKNSDPDPLAARLTKVAERFALFSPPFFIVIAMATPGALTLYWTTSGIYGVGQILVTHWLARKEQQKTPGPKSLPA